MDLRHIIQIIVIVVVEQTLLFSSFLARMDSWVIPGETVAGMESLCSREKGTKLKLDEASATVELRRPV